MDNTFDKSESKVFDFMQAVEDQKAMDKQDEDFKNSTNYKLRKLDENREIVNKEHLEEIFSRIFKDAVPLSDDYKNANKENLKNYFNDFIKNRNPNGLQFYIHEALKKNNSPFVKKILEAVEDITKNEYTDKALNIDDIKPNELVFNSPYDNTTKIDIVGKDLEIPELVNVIKNNVKQTALSEITRAKKEKEMLKNVEAELVNDINVDTPEKVEEAVELRGLTKKKDYVPTLFEGVMIASINKINYLFESGKMQNENIYGALDEYKSDNYIKTESVYGSIEDLAFIEAVKEYTCLSMLKALKLESFDIRYVNDLANEYAYTVKL